jgi:hypothetical protein
MNIKNVYFQAASNDYIANDPFPHSPSHLRPMTLIEKARGLCGTGHGNFVNKYTGEQFDDPKPLSSEETAIESVRIQNIVAQMKIKSATFPSDKLDYGNGNTHYGAVVYELYYKHGYVPVSIERTKASSEFRKDEIVSVWSKTGFSNVIISNLSFTTTGPDPRDHAIYWIKASLSNE